jgi:hypothetical protein
MYKILHYTDLEWSRPKTVERFAASYTSNIENAYKELTDEDKKKYNALMEGAFKEKYLNPERYKFEQTRLDPRQHACHACQNDIHATTAAVKKKSTWANSITNVILFISVLNFISDLQNGKSFVDTLIANILLFPLALTCLVA